MTAPEGNSALYVKVNSAVSFTETLNSIMRRDADGNNQIACVRLYERLAVTSLMHRAETHTVTRFSLLI